MAATLTNDKTKLRQEIQNLELEEAEIEKGILNGTISKEEGQKKRTDLSIRLAELNASDGNIEQPTETEDSTHKKDASHKEEHPHLHQETDHTEQPAQELSTPDASAVDINTPTATQASFSPTVDTASQPTTSSNQSAALPPSRPPNVPPISTSSKRQKVAKGAGKFMMYTSPGGFIIGKAAQRSKERETARKEVESLGKKDIKPSENIQKSTPTKTNQPTAPVDDKTPPPAKSKSSTTQKNPIRNVNIFSPKGWGQLGKKILPKKIRARFDTKQEEPQETAEIQPASKPADSTQHKEVPLQSGSVHKEINKEVIQYATPMAWVKLGKKILPDKIKAPLEKLAPKKPEETAQTQPEHNHKTAGEYQKTWNKNIISQAILKGYNRSATLQHIRNSKIWQSRAWKYGKYALNPALAGYHDARKQFSKKQDNNSSQTSSPSNPIKSRPTRNIPSEGISPTSLYKKTWNKFGGSPISRLNTAMGRRLGSASPQSVRYAGKRAVSKTARKVGGRAAQKLGQQAASQLAQLGGRAALLNPPVLIAIGVGILILIIICVILLIIMSLSGSEENVGGGSGATPLPNQTANPIPGFTLTLSTPTTIADQLDIITYTVTYSYSGSNPEDISKITIFEDVPTGTEYVGTSGAANVSTQTNNISWDLSNTANASPFTFTLKVVDNNFIISNKVYATMPTSTGGGGNIPPTAENCNNTYTLENPLGNFGDPDCYFAENKEQAMSELYDLLKAEDPANAANWYLKVIPCESVPPYNPNSHSSSAAIGSPDAAGVWGMYSMGRGKNGEFDHGDVPWRLQTTNAVNYGKNLTNLGLGLGAYWECWRRV